MMQITNISYVLRGFSNQRRVFSTSQSNHKVVGMTIQGVLKLRGPRELKPHKVLSKLLEKSTSRRKGFFANPAVGAPFITLKTAISSLTCSRAPITKRAMILNKMFMKNITEILCTSDLGLPLLRYDVEFSEVKLNSNFSVVNVLWIPRGTEDDDEIQNLLNKIAAPLRSELIGLGVMGVVPRIHFVKDKHMAILAEIDRRLKIADFGEDYIPSLKESDHLKENLQLITHLPTELKEKIAELESSEEFKEDEEQPLPSIRMDVFGLDYLKIKRSIQNGMKKSKINETYLEEILTEKNAVFDVEMAEQPKICNKQNIRQYLKNKRIAIRKAQDETKNKRERDIVASFQYEKVNQENNDEMYEEFVKYAFEDQIEEHDDSYERYKQQQ